VSVRCLIDSTVSDQTGSQQPLVQIQQTDRLGRSVTLKMRPAAFLQETLVKHRRDSVLLRRLTGLASG
jgi:hypothetical protein